jgi:hypothetical protein
MIPNVGGRYRSRVSAVQVIITKAPTAGVELSCGGWPMDSMEHDGAGESQETLNEEYAGETVLGKRYEDAASGLELLVIQGGDGLLHVGDRLLETLEAKKLPASD